MPAIPANNANKEYDRAGAENERFHFGPEKFKTMAGKEEPATEQRGENGRWTKAAHDRAAHASAGAEAYEAALGTCTKNSGAEQEK